MAIPMTAEQANAVYDTLVEHAGAQHGWMRENFALFQTAGGTDEFRFGGALGFGGKFWNCNGRWYVSAYPEDVKRWPEMAQIIDVTNGALAALKAEFAAAKLA